MEKHKEIIECPECGKRQTAEVFHPLPWWSYIHVADRRRSRNEN